MTNSEHPSPPSTLTLVEKLYAVHNINSLIPEKLDLAESNYSTWSYFFKGHCSNFGVLKHIEEPVTEASTSTPPTDEWITADSIVKSWIFFTLSSTLRKRLIKANPKTAKAAWDAIVKSWIFLTLSLQLDVKNAFLHGSLSETVYMQQPPGFRDSQHPDHVCLLQRSLYGLKQAPRAWWGSDTAYLLLYVDDIILIASSTAFLQSIIATLHAEFSMTDLGSLNYFLGISVTCNTSGMFLSQQKYASELLERAGMLTCNPCRTPVDTDSKLSVDGDPVSNPTLYRSLAGALQYLTFTRPDISYAVQHVCLYMHDPREPHFSALKRILRYIRGTMPYGLQLFSSTTSSLVAYSDADWAGCPTTRRAEAEYWGVANAVAETCWLRNLLRELHTPLSTATLVYCDNVSAVYLSSNHVQHQRTKHIEIDIHFVRDLVSAGHIRVLHVPSRYKYADIFIKGLPTVLFDEFRSNLSVRSSPAQTAGDVSRRVCMAQRPDLYLYLVLMIRPNV
ncbi:ribonuclease H-like domain-containing protein [Tanacetum coccineum]